ncbi:MAG TPA: hypothetical protein VFN10_06420 [Thermoanaerobaculia bacterium]|nr:hypothetical protein [Thermoanaerobaculia bacterium]
MRRLALLLLAFTVPALAQNAPLFPRFSITGGAYQADFSTDVRVDEDLAGANGATTGTRINLERDLGLDEQHSVRRFEARWRPFARHELAASILSADRSGFAQINRDITFRDVTYPVQAEVATTFDVDYRDLTYTYWAHRADRNGIGIMLGAAGISIDASIIANSAAGGVAITQQASTDVPVALGGVQARFALTRNLLAEGSIGVLPRVTIDQYSGRALNGAVAIEWRLTPSLGIGAEYRDFRLDGSVARVDFNGDLDMRVNGAEAFVRLALP